MAHEVPRASSIPSHLRGRRTEGGPITGCYFPIVFMLKDIDNSAGTTASTANYRMKAPADGRIVEVCHNAEDVNSTTPQFTVKNGGNDVVAATNFAESTTVTVVPAASLSNVAFSKGDIINVVLTCAASEELYAPTVVVTCWLTGHVAASPAND